LIDARLLGRWRLVSDAQEIRVAEFDADGRLTYRVELLDRELVLLLTFHVDGAFLVTTQPPGSDETRSQYEIVDDTLVMGYGAERFTYRRMR
jgi:hypothetical protein